MSLDRVPLVPGLLFLQIAVILGLALGVGRVLARLQQPAVVAQMIAGVMLGPSLFGLLLPDWQAALFPPASLPVLNGLGQVGVAIFMFGLGFEIDFGFVRRNLRSAAAVGAGGVVLPLAVGALLGACAGPRRAAVPAAGPPLGRRCCSSPRRWR